MKVAARTGPYTYEDFCRMVREDEKADLIDGVIYMASPENTDANELFMWLSGLMHDFAEYNDLGKVYGSRVALRLDSKNSPEPDIAFVKKEHLSRIERGGIAGPADLAVEIVSPDSVERDYDQKRRQFERFGITEYWIVDEELQKFTLLRLGRKGKYREVKPQKGILRSEVLQGFWLRPEWVWQNPRPKKMDVLSQLIQRGPQPPGR
jgi:Uma2 family endonuclease